MEYTLEILKYIGKFHPLVLHLPIGSLLMTFLLLVVSRYQKVDFEKAIRVGVDFSFVGAFMAAKENSSRNSRISMDTHLYCPEFHHHQLTPMIS